MPRKINRAAQGSGSIRQRPDGKWEARYTAGRDSGTGRQIQKSVYGSTQGEVRKKLALVTAAIDEGVYTEPSKLSVGQWLDIWTAEYLGSVKPRTIDSYKSNCKVYLKPALGAIKLSSLSVHPIQTLNNKLHRERNLSAKTLKNIHGVLHKALQQAVELGYIKYNPADACKLPRVERKVTPLDNEAVSAFLEAIQGHK